MSKEQELEKLQREINVYKNPELLNRINLDDRNQDMEDFLEDLREAFPGIRIFREDNSIVIKANVASLVIDLYALAKRLWK